jgi:hypothetical protein
MRTFERTATVAISSFLLIGSAAAVEMTGAQLKELFSGKSVYLENTATSTAGVGQGVIYYATNGNATYKTGNGRVLHGTWSIKGNTSCIDWKEVPNNPCSRYDKQGETISVINIATGQTRGKILKIVDGNPEKL